MLAGVDELATGEKGIPTTIPDDLLELCLSHKYIQSWNRRIQALRRKIDRATDRPSLPSMSALPSRRIKLRFYLLGQGESTS